MRYLALLLLLVSAGCLSSGPTVLHPIEKADIFSVMKGEKITRADGSVLIVEKNGWFLSDFYVKAVMDAKIRAKTK